jgi:hypothetical protein
MAMKYFIHCYRAPQPHPDFGMIPESVACMEIIKWGIEPNALRLTVPLSSDKTTLVLESLHPGNRFYIVENHGQCWEPNGDIIWSWAGGLEAAA